MKVGKTTTSLTLKIEAEGYSSKLAYSTAQTKASLTIKGTYSDSFNTKMNYSLNLEKDGDFSKFKLVYALGTEKMTITSTKISGDVVTFKAVDGDGDVIGGLLGAAAGTAVAHQKVGQPITLGSGAVIHMHLRAPIDVRVRN